MIYVGIAHSILQATDPLLETATMRVQELSRQTWSNQVAFKVCFAALALAMRGINVDTMFSGALEV